MLGLITKPLLNVSFDYIEFEVTRHNDWLMRLNRNEIYDYKRFGQTRSNDYLMRLNRNEIYDYKRFGQTRHNDGLMTLNRNDKYDYKRFGQTRHNDGLMRLNRNDKLSFQRLQAIAKSKQLQQRLYNNWLISPHVNIRTAINLLNRQPPIFHKWSLILKSHIGKCYIFFSS